MKAKLKKLYPLCINKLQTTKNGTRMITVPKAWARLNTKTSKELHWFLDVKNNWLVLVPLEEIEQIKKEKSNYLQQHTFGEQ